MELPRALGTPGNPGSEPLLLATFRGDDLFCYQCCEKGTVTIEGTTGGRKRRPTTAIGDGLGCGH